MTPLEATRIQAGVVFIRRGRRLVDMHNNLLFRFVTIRYLETIETINMVAKIATLLVILTLSALSSVLSQSGCPLSGADEKFLIDRRKQVLRASLLAQLGLKNTSSFPAVNRTVTKEQLDTYLALSEAAASREEEKQRQCQSEEIYARPITTIVGTIDDSK